MMNTGEVIAVVLLALLMGAGLLAMGLFFWYLLKTMKQVEKSIGEFVRVLDPLVKTGSLQQLSGAAATLVGIGKQALTAMNNINLTVGVFNKAFFDQTKVGAISQEPAAEDFAPEGSSGVFSSTEDELVQREAAQHLRDIGIETDASRTIERPEKMYGGKV
jgi:hypothetical protein